MTVTLETQEFGWLNEVHGTAQGITDYWLGQPRKNANVNSGFPFAGWNLAASADTLNVAQNPDRATNGFE